MIPKAIRTFWTEDRAAISPLYAVGILALVGVSGVGFDYGRLMALDSELQNAADQAALAAATQLDGGDDAMTRARDAATNAFAAVASDYVNETRFANDTRITSATNTRPITNLTFKFYDGYEDDALGGEVAFNNTDGGDAEVVEVTVNARQVFYALTPVVGAMNSGPVIGKALAALETGTCNVPPMMFCVPEVGGIADASFPGSDDIGKGLKLHFKANGPDSPGNPNDETVDDDSVWAPGNFGFLDLEYLPNGQGQNQTTGLNAAILGCTGAAPISDPGFRTPQGSALNTRFDDYTNPAPNCDDSTGNYCPAENVRRDMVSVQRRNNVAPANLATQTCDAAPPNNSWEKIASLPATATTPDILVRPPLQGFPQDGCFLSGANTPCTMIGNQTASSATPNWNAAAYMTEHHGGTALSTAAPNGTRYEVYKWELEDMDSRLSSPDPVGYFADKRNSGNNFDVDLYCSYPQAVNEDPVPATLTQKDRRILTVAAVDCTGLNGKDAVKIVRWVDLFLVQPVATTANDRNFFTEIVGPAKQANGNSGFQYFGRKKAVLIR